MTFRGGFDVGIPTASTENPPLASTAPLAARDFGRRRLWTVRIARLTRWTLRGTAWPHSGVPIRASGPVWPMRHRWYSSTAVCEPPRRPRGVSFRHDGRVYCRRHRGGLTGHGPPLIGRRGLGEPLRPGEKLRVRFMLQSWVRFQLGHMVWLGRPAGAHRDGGMLS